MAKRKIKHKLNHLFAEGGVGSLAGGMDMSSSINRAANATIKTFDTIANATGLYDKLGYPNFNMLANFNFPTTKTDLTNLKYWATHPTNTTVAEKEGTLDDNIIGNLTPLDLSNADGYTFMDAYNFTKPFANGGRLFSAGGVANNIANVAEGVANIAATTAETAKTNAQIRNLNIANNILSNNSSIYNTTAMTNTDDGLLLASSNSRSAYNLGKDMFTRNRRLNIGTTAIGSIKGSLLGASAGSNFGPYGAAIGAVVGGLAGLAGGVFGARKGKRNASKMASRLRNSAEMANLLQSNILMNALNRTNLNRERMLMHNLRSYGGALDFDLANRVFDIQDKNSLNKLKMTLIANSFGFGGMLSTNGGDWKNGITYFDEGGRHEENPNQGIPQGIASDGQPNLVEQGEVKWDDQDYIFSDRLKPQDQIKNKYKLGGNLTYADSVKKLTKESEERPNDPISKRGRDKILEDLANDQEELKAKKELERMLRLIESLSPQELMLLQLQAALQQLAELQLMEELLMQELQMLDPLMQEALMLQLLMDPQMLELMMQELMMQGSPLELLAQRGYANGGHLFKLGGKLIAELRAAYKKDPNFDLEGWLVKNKLTADDISIEELSYITSGKILSDNFSKLYGTRRIYDPSRWKGTTPLVRGANGEAVKLQDSKAYREHYNRLFSALNNGPEDPYYYQAMKYVMTVDDYANKILTDGKYKRVLREDGTIDFDRLRELKFDDVYGPWHTYMDEEDNFIEIPPYEPPTTPPPGKNPPGITSTKYEQLPLYNRKSEALRYTPIATSIQNYLDILNKDPNFVAAPGTSYVGPQTINDYLEYRPSDTRRLWNDLRQALLGNINNINNGNSASNNAMRIAAMNLMQNALGSLLSLAEEANYNRRALAVQLNAAVNQFNALAILNADIQNKNAYIQNLKDLFTTALKNNDYSDDIFNARLAARNQVGLNLGKLGSENRALNMALATLLANGVENPYDVGYLIGSVDRKDYKDWRNRYNKNIEDINLLNAKNKRRREIENKWTSKYKGLFTPDEEEAEDAEWFKNFEDNNAYLYAEHPKLVPDIQLLDIGSLNLPDLLELIDSKNTQGYKNYLFDKDLTKRLLKKSYYSHGGKLKKNNKRR